jgi:hypothetical protein
MKNHIFDAGGLTLRKSIALSFMLSFLFAISGRTEAAPAEILKRQKPLPESSDIVEARFMRGFLDVDGVDCDAFFEALAQKVFAEMDRLDLYYDGTAGCGRNTPEYDILVYVINESDRPLLDQLAKLLNSVDLWGHMPVLRLIARVVYDVTVRGALYEGDTSANDGYAWFIRRFNAYQDFATYIEESLVPNVRDGSLPVFMQWLAAEAGADQATAFKASLPNINRIDAFGTVSLVTPDNDVFRLSGMRGMIRDCDQSASGRCDQ